MKRILVIIGITCLVSAYGSYLSYATGDIQKGEDTSKDYLKIGEQLIRDETIGFLKIGSSDKVVIKNLGVAREKSKAAIWEADGEEHQTWFYRKIGIELDMVRKGKIQVIDMITIRRPCKYKTNRNIGISSKKDDVLKSYRDEINPEDTSKESIVAGSIYGGIIFRINNERVESIFIGASAE